MLHDGVMCHDRSAAGPTERRTSDRVPYPAELTLLWHHDLEHVMRYRIVDVSDGGFRIRAAAPVIEGMTGTVLRLLPDGQKLNQSVMVRWVRQSEGGLYDIGLRTFRPSV
jgi:hypothetical protein